MPRLVSQWSGAVISTDDETAKRLISNGEYKEETSGKGDSSSDEAPASSKRRNK
jgi:hypothetical protein